MVARTLFQEPGTKRERFLRATAPVARVAVRADYTVNAQTAARARDRVVQAMDKLEADLQPVGLPRGRALQRGRPHRRVALHAARGAPGASLRAVGADAPVQELRDELMARPGGQWIERMYALHRNGPRVEAPHAVGG